MRTLLFLDVETAGLDSSAHPIVELAAVLWCGVELASISSLVWAQSNPAAPLNGIPESALSHRAIMAPCLNVFGLVDGLARYADIIVCHNNGSNEIPFDKAMLEARRQSPADGVTPWLDSHDIDYSVPTSSKSLTSLCIAHGVPVTRAHRALTDCRLIARLFERLIETGHDLDAMIDRALRPKVLVKALVGFDDNHLAKAKGFRWDPTTKRWLRRMPAEDCAALGFGTQIQNG
jgi:DNA polymerase-3 subunit epsilon